MEVREVSLPIKNRLLQDYIDAKPEIQAFFDYNPQSSQCFEQRIKELSSRTFPREALTSYLTSFHKRFGADEKTLSNIERLQDPKSTVVIGGQQAGLLTGPLYTIYKIITILHKAKQKEHELGVPVLPVFWVAGEDHDFEEINHVFVRETDRIKKIKINQKLIKKASVSDVTLDESQCEHWLQRVFELFGETEFTNEVLGKINKCLHESTTYVEFFIRLVYQLFPNEGLIVVDSGDKKLREIEAPFFKQLVKKNEQLSESVFSQQLDLKEAGYGEPIDLHRKSSHLFYLNHGERVLLENDTSRGFRGKNNQCELTEEELLHVVATNPELLSNNVVSRPLMQDYLFPVVAFIAGPGEIAYWATLKKAFHLFGFKVPPIIQRFGYTVIERHIKEYKNAVLPHTRYEDILFHGIKHFKEEWLKSKNVFHMEEKIANALEQIKEIHYPLQQLAAEIDPGLEGLSQKNLQMIEGQLEFLKKKMEQSIEKKHEALLRKFDAVDSSLRPLSSPQERICNVFYFINKYGLDFASRMNELHVAFDDKHKVIFL